MKLDQRIIIVAMASHEKEYAEKLYNRIKTNYSQYSVFLWDEEAYKTHKMKIAESDKIIFFGKARKLDACAKDDNLRGKFNKFGMQYGWAGNICVIYASGADISWKSFLGSFRDYCKRMHEKYSDVPIPKNDILSEVFGDMADDKRAGYRCQYSALLHEFLDGGGFKGFMANANTQAPAFRRIADQLPDNNAYNKKAASLVLWETLETRDEYKIQKSEDLRFNCFRILDGENELVAWGDLSLEKLGIMAFLALFEEKIIEIVETQDADKKHDVTYKTLDSLKPIEQVVKEAETAIKEKKRTIKDSQISSVLVGAIPEVLAGFMGGGVGAAGSFAALYFMGSVVGLSASGITSGLAALGALIGGGMAAGIFVLAVPITLLASVSVGMVMGLKSKELKQRKERLLQKAIEMQQAIIVQIKSEVDVQRQRADYLNSLNELLRRVIADLQGDLEV